jgi:hypothetical protein
MPKGFNHRTRSARAGVAIQQDHPCGSHVQGQTQQGADQQHRGKNSKVQSLLGVRGHHHHHQRHGYVEREENIQYPRGQRQHHHGQDGHDHQWRANALKNLISAVIYSIATLTFVIAGRVSWYELAILLTGATIGGYVGGALGEKLAPALLRCFVILVGSTMTLYYFWSTYFSA